MAGQSTAWLEDESRADLNERVKMEVELTDEEEVAKEMFDATYNRVDIVSGPASGMRFVVLKAGESQDPMAVWKVKYSAEEQRTMLAAGKAFKGPDGEPSYPIADGADLKSAIHAVGMGNESHDSIRKYIIKRAKAMGKSSEIPDTWAADGSLKEAPVAKSTAAVKKAGVVGDDPAAEIVSGDDEPLATADELDAEKETNADGVGVPTESPGDPDDPTSPAWEAVDAARARQALQLTIALQRLVTVAQNREAQEGALGADEDSFENVWNLSDVLDALDCVLELLAPFAVTEQAEADQRTAEQTIVLKSGRILSANNEAAIKSAVESLQSVLASLPEAPVVKGQESDVSESEAVTKAKGDPQVAVYTADGKLVGTVDQADLNPIAAPAPPEGGDAQSPTPAPDNPDDTDSDDDSGSDDDETVTAPDAAPTGDPAAQAAAPVTAPAEEVAPVAKSEEIAAVVKSAIDEATKTITEGYENVIKQLSDRLAYVEAQPAPGGPLLSGLPSGGGFTPAGNGHMELRGQNATGDPELMAVAKALNEETDPVRQADLRREMTRLSFKRAYSAQ